jgi:hypothetical protein
MPTRRYGDTHSRCADPMRGPTAASCRARDAREKRDDHRASHESFEEVTSSGVRSPQLYDSRPSASPSTYLGQCPGLTAEGPIMSEAWARPTET